jgi:S-DNA-T family DNA segregation ATPase FtsK/SpoIIIE
MSRNTYKSNTFKKAKIAKEKKRDERSGLSFRFLKDRRFQLSVGLFLLIAAFFLITSFTSYIFTGQADQSVVEAFSESKLKESGLEIENWFGMVGALTAHYFIFLWFGLAAFLIPPFLFLLGHYVLFGKQWVPLRKAAVFVVFFLIWISTVIGYVTLTNPNPLTANLFTGGIGFELAVILDALMGWGTYLLLIFFFLVFIIYFFNITGILDMFGVATAHKSDTQDYMPATDEEDYATAVDNDHSVESENWIIEQKKAVDREERASKDLELAIERQNEPGDPVRDEQPAPAGVLPGAAKAEPEFSVNEDRKEEKVVGQLENFDPKLDLRDYRYPILDLLKRYDRENVQVTKEELEQNKDNIVETLINFKIGISSIKATIGPTVTLYEIVPDAGVKISRIKNLEDDIALSLAALGIRIIAPIPGKGTIGIEVPNKNRELVSAYSVLATQKFQNTGMDLPVILGKTIQNEVYLADLTKMPHLLMAGATGQGKSVGLNILIASLLYKRHPAQLKFVLVDPKKVELTLYNKIEKHFLAMLPDSEEAIITENKKVIHSLNSLCIEMDNRLLLLKNAGCRNLKEYNQKFENRQLNPEKGHRYLPYIVLIIDELADLMVTSGKEIETPIARLAAVSRATGIHLVLATQRPSVNVITGIIKANFPARLSYRVTAKVDSRTILDSGGAEQLVGLGDMLYSHGSEIVRLQGPFIDTSEVETICNFIGDQRGYEHPYLLPEYSDEDNDAPGAVDLGERDNMFEEAARLIVRHQQGSTSLIQRKLKLGYNRAGRLIDQLEAAGVVGPFEGSKAREVLVQDEYSLEQLLNEINDKYT